MRRKGSDVYAPARLRALEEACAGIDPAFLVEVLSPFATEDRLQRMRDVFAARVDSVTVVMDAPHDPHNGAAVVRTCDAFGVAHLHVIERRETFLASASVSRGSEKWIDVVTYRRAADAIASLKSQGYELVATDAKGTLLPEDLATIPRFALVLGNERDGVADDLRAAATRTVRVPMRGFAESLNVSVTGAILLENAVRHRPGDLPEAARLSLLARGLLRSLERARDILVARGVLPP